VKRKLTYWFAGRVFCLGICNQAIFPKFIWQPSQFFNVFFSTTHLKPSFEVIDLQKFRKILHS
jgi:hypothetical protein